MKKEYNIKDKYIIYKLIFINIKLLIKAIKILIIFTNKAFNTF